MKHIVLTKDSPVSERFLLDECTVIEAKSADGTLFSISLSDFTNNKSRSVIIKSGDGRVDINDYPLDFKPEYFQFCYHRESCKVSYRTW